MITRNVSITIIILFLTFFYSLVINMPISFAQDNNYPSTFEIVVNNQPLTGTFNIAQTRGERIFLPVLSIARVLGDNITVNEKTVEVRRQTGVIADFQISLRQVRENGLVILVVANTSDIIFPQNPDELLLPIEIMGALFDVSVTIDKDTKTIKIVRGQVTTSNVAISGRNGPIELTQLDYMYNVSEFSATVNQNLVINSKGYIGNDQFSFLTNFNSGNKNFPVDLQRITFTYDRTNGQHFIAGDFGRGADLKLISGSLRGVLFQQPVKSILLTVFAGRTISEILPVRSDAPIQLRAKYDTTVLGTYASFSTNNLLASTSLFSGGFFYFQGPNRKGQMATATFRSTSLHNFFEVDVGLGTFTGQSSFRKTVDGSGFAVDIADSFKLLNNLTLQGHYLHISPNFLNPEGGGLFKPINLISGGISYQPISLITASISGKVSKQLDDSNQESNAFTTTISIAPRHRWFSLLLSHSENNDSTIGNSKNSSLNVISMFGRWRLFSNVNRLEVLGLTTINTLIGTSVQLNKNNAITVSQSFSNEGSLSGAIDYQTTQFFTQKISFGAGFGYSQSGSKLSFNERLLTTIKLPLSQTLQVTYVHNPNNTQLLAQLNGSLLLNRKNKDIVNLPIGIPRDFGVIFGKVYQDIDMNGTFDNQIDKPLSDVQVQVDGKYFTTTDINGDYRIDNLQVGEHTIILTLQTVRADLTLLDKAQKYITIHPKEEISADFRLIRTGRISGLVWLDLNNNGVLDEGEKPLIGVRVVLSNNRDTQTDNNGCYVIGDVAPGEYILFLDEKTLPANTKATNTKQVVVKAGLESNNNNLGVIIPVNIRKF